MMFVAARRAVCGRQFVENVRSHGRFRHRRSANVRVKHVLSSTQDHDAAPAVLALQVLQIAMIHATSCG